MMYELRKTKQFRKDVKLCAKQGKDLTKLEHAIGLLQRGERLPPDLDDHSLQGDYKSFRECHLEDDWLLVYRYENDVLVLALRGTGTHQHLFGG